MTSSYLSEHAETQRLVAMLERISKEAVPFGRGFNTFPQGSDFWKLPHSLQLDILNYLMEGGSGS